MAAARACKSLDRPHFAILEVEGRSEPTGAGSIGSPPTGDPRDLMPLVESGRLTETSARGVLASSLRAVRCS